MAHEFDWSVNYPSQRSPVFGRRIVATSHPLAAHAGTRIMLAGGNAVDAAIAAAAVMTVVEPVSNGLGSDAFCILWDGKRLHGLNASGRAPAAWTPEYFRARYGESVQNPPMRGWDSVTVPGAVSAWVALSERFGKLPFEALLEPAIEVAERGYAVPPVVQFKWAAAVPLLRTQPGFAQTFMPNGRAPNIGEMFHFRAAARSLRSIAQTKGDAFYRGEIAEAIVRMAKVQGGALEMVDFANHHVDWLEPLTQRYRGYTVHELPPNGQGIAALIALGLLERFDIAGMRIDGALAQHLMIEAMKLSFADVYRYVADPSAMRVTPQQMLSATYLDERARQIDPHRAQVFGAGNFGKGGTIYLTAADDSGMMVSFIQSNFMGFGSGIVVPEYGVSLQNRGHAFSLDPNSPNRVAPGKRPFHTIIPAFVTRGGVPVMSFGVMGANMQPQGHMQTLVRMIDHKQHPQAASDAPRWRFNQGLEINVERQMPAETVRALGALGHKIEMLDDSYQDFGAGQFIWRLGDVDTHGYVAASDHRRDGAAVGF